MAVGFTVLDEEQLLIGTVVRVKDEVADDGDWCFHVSPNNKSLLVNHKGHANRNGLIECEVQPTGAIYGGEWSRDDVLRHFLRRIDETEVWVVGAHVADSLHSTEDEKCGATWSNPWPWSWYCSDRGKTEIHPVTSIISFPSHFGRTPVNRVEVFVFSDCARRLYSIAPHQPPNSNVSRVGEFMVRIAPAGEPGETSASYKILSEADLARSKAFRVSVENGYWGWRGTIESGTEKEGKGFYHATVELRYEGKKIGVTTPSFPRTTIGASNVRPLEIRNEGSDELTIKISAPPPGSPFRWPEVSEQLAVGDTRDVPITFQPTTIGSFGGMVVVEDDAPGRPHRIGLSGKGQSSECPNVLMQLEKVKAEIDGLRRQRQTATPPEKASITQEIAHLEADLDVLVESADSLGCH